MAVPNFQDLTLPLLRKAADGSEHALADVRDSIATELGLTEAEREEMLPRGRQGRFVNRLAWAKVYLQQAGLLSSPRRGHFKITARGREVLDSSPERIDVKFLEQFPEFLAFRNRKGTVVRRVTDSEPETPEEEFEAAHLKMRAGLASELLDRLKAASPRFFERLIVELLVKMGYGGSREDAGQAIGKSGDEGIDGVIAEDRLGLDIVYLQAKKWEGSVGRPEIQKFVGALHGKRARKGVFITTGSFSAEARAYVSTIDPKVVLIDGDRLAELMIDFDVGITPVASYHIKRIDSDYFDED
jgi:restriction system protein